MKKDSTKYIATIKDLFNKYNISFYTIFPKITDKCTRIYNLDLISIEKILDIFVTTNILDSDYIEKNPALIFNSKNVIKNYVYLKDNNINMIIDKRNAFFLIKEPIEYSSRVNYLLETFGEDIFLKYHDSLKFPIRTIEEKIKYFNKYVDDKFLLIHICNFKIDYDETIKILDYIKENNIDITVKTFRINNFVIFKNMYEFCLKNDIPFAYKYFDYNFEEFKLKSIELKEYNITINATSLNGYNEEYIKQLKNYKRDNINIKQINNSAHALKKYNKILKIKTLFKLYNLDIKDFTGSINSLVKIDYNILKNTLQTFYSDNIFDIKNLNDIRYFKNNVLVFKNYNFFKDNKLKLNYKKETVSILLKKDIIGKFKILLNIFGYDYTFSSQKIFRNISLNNLKRYEFIYKKYNLLPKPTIFEYNISKLEETANIIETNYSSSLVNNVTITKNANEIKLCFDYIIEYYGIEYLKIIINDKKKFNVLFNQIIFESKETQIKEGSKLYK